MESREERRAVTQVHVIQLCNQSGDSNMITASNAKSGALKENIWFQVYLTDGLLPWDWTSSG